MKVSKELPPNYKEIKERLNPPNTVVFTYGDTIYAPFINFALPDDLIFHEETHMKRQGEEPAVWWRKYLNDSKFRFVEELTAYRVQYQFYLRHNNRNETYFFLNQIARDLSSEIYGNIVDYDTAHQLIKQ